MKKLISIMLAMILVINIAGVGAIAAEPERYYVVNGTKKAYDASGGLAGVLNDPEVHAGGTAESPSVVQLYNIAFDTANLLPEVVVSYRNGVEIRSPGLISNAMVPGSGYTVFEYYNCAFDLPTRSGYHTLRQPGIQLKFFDCDFNTGLYGVTGDGGKPVDLYFEDCTFTESAPVYGGGFAGDVTIKNCTFSGMINVTGGGYAGTTLSQDAYGGNATFTMENCVFTAPGLSASEYIAIYANHYVNYNIQDCSHAFYFYKSNGWYSQGDFRYTRQNDTAETAYADSNVAAGERALYAITPATVTYDGNGADSGSVVDTTQYAPGGEFTVLDNDFYRAGHSFAGWNTKADGSGAAYQPNAAGKLKLGAAPVVLYAQWEEVEQYTVTVNYLDEDGAALQAANETTAVNAGSSYDVGSLIPAELTVGENHYVKVSVSGDVSGTADGHKTVIATYALDNIGEDDDDDGRPDDPDNISDKYQKKVTFRVANGNWNDDTDADRVVYVTLMTDGVWDADGSAVLDVPEVGEKPDSGFQTGGWDVAPPAQVSGAEDAFYTYVYARSTTPVIPGDRVNYPVEHYKADLDGGYPTQPTEQELLGGKIGDRVTASAKTYDGYCVNLQAQGTVASGTLTAITKAEDIVVLKLYYDLDRIGEDDDDDGRPDDPDNIPDKYQKKVTFQVEHGNWNDGTDADRVVYVTLMTDGVWDADGSAVLDVPEVGEKPDSGFQTGGWDVAPPAQVSGAEDAFYTYAYEQIIFLPVTPSTGTVKLTKVDADDNCTPLANVGFNLYEASGRLQGTYTTDENGTIIVKNLTVGEYYWVEVRPAEGYVLDASKHAVTVSGWRTTDVVVTNTRSAVPDVFCGDHDAYVVGYDDGLIRPEANITRAEVATIFFRLLDDAVREQYLTKVSPFPDVEEGKWYHTAVSTMAAMGVVNGCPDGNFYPNANVTRAEFAAIAARFDANGNTAGVPFDDIYEHWAQREINVAYNNGWVLGYEDGTFRPDRDLTRAEAFALINRVLQRVPEHRDDLPDDMVIWPDNMDTDKWYYLAVQEATNSHDYTRKESGYEQWTQLKEVRDWTALEQ